MKKFENPEMEIVELKLVDVITTSSDDDGFVPGENEFPIG